MLKFCSTCTKCSGRMRKRHECPTSQSSLEKASTSATASTLRNRDSIHSVPFYIGVILLLLVLGLFEAVYYIDEALPVPLTLEDEKLLPDAFITDRVQHNLKRLTAFGPRVAGGYENEMLAVDFIQREINFIQQRAHKNQQIEVDVQEATGSYYLNITPGGRINAYSNLQNIVVKLHAKNYTRFSLLVNSHFDSVPTSPGGSDDGINVVAMLEILRKLSKAEDRPLHNVIFLFNGAEETGLQASHGFISNHKWAKECKVVINLEACGAGGKIILFQSGPSTPWLMKYYNQVPHPYGQAAGEEIFQSNLIPSDTDFRIFRDFGGLVGVDMAFFKDGYRYHTKYDDYAHIPRGSFQHVGDNTLLLVKSLANAPELSQTNNKMGKTVYFDVLGWFMVCYTQFTGNAINYIVILLSFAVFLLSVRNFKFGYTKQTLVYMVLTFSAIIAGWVLSAIFMSLTALFIDCVEFSMRWYGHPWLLIGLYALPTVALSGCILPLIKHKNIEVNVKCHIQAHSVRIIWTLILLIGTALNIRSMYAVMIPVAFNTLAFIIIYIFKLQHTIRKWQIVYLVGMLMPTMFLMYTSITTLSLFIPITGRIGPDKNADLLIGVLTLLFTILIISPFVALITLVRKLKYLQICMWAGFVVSLIITFTPLSFPYSGDKDQPTPQRYWILHTRRVFHGQNGSEIKRDAGYFMLNMDRNSPNILKPYVKELDKARSLEQDCDDYLMCGLPLAHSKMVQIMEYSTWIPAGQPILSEPVRLSVVSKLNLSATVVRYNVSITGPDRMGVYLSPKLGNAVTNISLMDGVPSDYVRKADGRPMYFIKYIYGKSAAPLQFTFDVKGDVDQVMAEVAISGIFVHDSLNRKMPHYIQFLNQFPDWADVTAWLGSYESIWI